MKKNFTLIFIILSLPAFSQSKYFVSELGRGTKDGRSWANAFGGISVALDQARARDTIWVEVGTYQGGFFLKEGVFVYGGFAGFETNLDERKLPGSELNQTILDGNSKFRVLTQESDFEDPTIWDGFIIQNGVSLSGAGVYLRKNGVIRRCIIKNNSTSLPSIGDYIPTEGGVVFRISSFDKKVWILAEDDFGRNYQIYETTASNINNLCDAMKDMDGKINSAYLLRSRAIQAIKSYRGGGKTDWYIPSSGEWALFFDHSSAGFCKSKIYDLVESALVTNGKQPLENKKYWSSTTALNNGMSASWYVNFGADTLDRINVWQYNRIRGVRYYTADNSDGKGGAVFATEGSRIEGCLILENNSVLGSGIYARGNVVSVNNTVVGNTIETSDNSSSPIDGDPSVKVYNTIIVNNVNSINKVNNFSGNSKYEYSAVETSSISSNFSNILLSDISEAKFISNSDYRLQTTSPLAEAGNPLYVPRDLKTDIIGVPRINKAKVSIGAFQPETSTNINTSVFRDLRIFPNPSKCGETLSIDLSSLKYNGVVLLELYDIVGKKLLSTMLKDKTIIQNPSQAGIYILRVLAGNEIKSEYKLIVTE